jgi:hypothetical protein
MIFEYIDDENFLLYAARYYDSSQCHDTDEFYEDLNRFKYIKKLITRYVETGELKERLILNHLIVLNNVFGPEHVSRMIYIKMHDQMKYIKPFLVLLNIMPDKISGITKNKRTIMTDEIPMDVNIVNVLRKI